jgi:hypothetical protein
VLEIANPSKAAERLDSDEKGITSGDTLYGEPLLDLSVIPPLDQLVFNRLLEWIDSLKKTLTKRRERLEWHREQDRLDEIARRQIAEARAERRRSLPTRRCVSSVRRSRKTPQAPPFLSAAGSREDDRATGMPLSQASSAETLGATSGALFSDFRAAQEAAGLTVTAPRHVAVSLRRAPSGVPSGPPVLPLTNSTQALPGKLDRIA